MAGVPCSDLQRHDLGRCTPPEGATICLDAEHPIPCFYSGFEVFSLARLAKELYKIGAPSRNEKRPRSADLRQHFAPV